MLSSGPMSSSLSLMVSCFVTLGGSGVLIVMFSWGLLELPPSAMFRMHSPIGVEAVLITIIYIIAYIIFI